MPPATACLVFVLLAASALPSPRVDQSARCPVRELTSPRVGVSASCPVTICNGHYSLPEYRCKAPSGELFYLFVFSNHRKCRKSRDWHDACCSENFLTLKLCGAALDILRPATWQMHRMRVLLKSRLLVFQVCSRKS